MVWLTGYTYRKKITIAGQAGAGTNYQVKLQIGNASGGDFNLSGHSQSFPNDIRFTSSDGSTQLDYWIENVAAAPITVWIEVADSLNSNVDIYCYYGKVSDATTSNGTNTFIAYNKYDVNAGDWSEINPNGHLNQDYVTTHRLNFTGLSRNEKAYVYKTISALSDFRLDYTVQYISSVRPPMVNVGFADTLNDANNVSNGLYYKQYDNTGYPWNGWLSHMTSGVESQGSGILLAANTTYYITFQRIGTSVAYKVYSDMARSAQVGSTLTYADTVPVAFTYFYAIASENDSNTANMTGWVDDIILRKYTSPEPTVTTFAEQTDTTYIYRKPITINNTSGNVLTNYQLPITINTSELIHAVPTSKMRSGCEDIRFTSDSSSYNEQNWSVSYPYWIESGIDSSSTKIWIKIDSITTGSNTIYMYYGNPNLTSASDGYATFIDFSGFETNFDGFPTTGIRSTAHSKTGSYSWMALHDSGYSRKPITVSVGTQVNFHMFLADSTSDSSQPTVSIGGKTWRIDPLGTWYLLDSSVWDNTGVTVSNIGQWQLVEFKYLATNSMTVIVGGVTLRTAVGGYSSGDPDGIGDCRQGLGVAYLDNILVRKFVATEPMLSSISAEQTITAKSMSITPRESPCRVGICVIDVSVTWTNTGESVTFTPKIIVDSTTYSLTSRALPAGDTPIAFAVSGLPVGNHTICPVPN